MLNHLNIEYLTEAIGRSATMSAKITLSWQIWAKKATFFHGFQKLSQIVVIDHNWKYLTEGIMSKLKKSNNVDRSLRF